MHNLNLIHQIQNQSPQSSGMDVIIVSTNTPQQEASWQKRLKQMRGLICKPRAVVIAVTEDWPGGAGNGLGTLYAYVKAQEKARFMYRTDIFDMQKKGASVAVYHTAGQGKRLYPITASEHNDKSAVKLPGFVGGRQLTLLEAVIAQTNHFGDQRPGRLSVFWGDQIFIPAKKPALNTENSHIEILGKVSEFPRREEWEQHGLHNYGVISIDRQGGAKLLEKIDYPSLTRLISKNIVSQSDSLAVSLGSFSLSPQMTFSLLREFEQEIAARHGKLDSDPHFWMPLTLEKETYIDLTSKNRESKEEAEQHYDRMQAFKFKFHGLHSNQRLFSVTDVGKNCYWWDYGSARSYFNNFLKMTSCNQEAEVMKIYFQVNTQDFRNGNRLIKDDRSCLVNCNIRSGKLSNCILIGVSADAIEAENCVIVNSSFSSLKANKSLFYNVQEKEDLKFSSGTFRADILLPKSQRHFSLYSHYDRDGKTDWNHRLPQNPMSFQEAYNTILAEL